MQVRILPVPIQKEDSMFSEGGDPEGTIIWAGDTVRVVNWAGPCLNDRVLKIGRARFKLERYGFKHFIEVHKLPCDRCTDHPQSQYPDGYTN